MLENYITPSKDTPSRSGLYWIQLPGVTLDLLSDLTKSDQEDWEEFAADIYERSVINFVGDVQAQLADKFNVDLKLVSRETSKFTVAINDSGLESGIKIEYRLPKYGKTQIISAEVFSDSDQADFTFQIKDKDSRVLKTVTTDLVTGSNVINIDTYFSADRLFITYDATLFDIRGTTNKYYDDYLSFNDLSCFFPCWGGAEGSVFQLNGGGFNVVFNSVCSIDKVVEQNINIFKEAFWYRIGLELMRERIVSDRFNRWTTLTEDRAKQLESAYMDECNLKLSNSIKSLRMREDTICFACKSIVYHSYQLP